MEPIKLTPIPDPPGTERGGADISECGLYRYTLWRQWDTAHDAKACAFIMLNPSTDPTVRKCVGFAKRWGCGSIIVVNLFAFRTPYPRELALAYSDGVDIIGPDNAEVLGTLLSRYSRRRWPIVVAWGAPKLKAIERLLDLQIRSLRLAAIGTGATFKCLGTAKDGNPRHPLMLAYDTPLTDWTPTEESTQ